MIPFGLYSVMFLVPPPQGMGQATHHQMEHAIVADMVSDLAPFDNDTMKTVVAEK